MSKRSREDETLREMRRLLSSLEDRRPQQASEELVQRTLHLARAELRSRPPGRAPSHAVFPGGFRRELSRLAAAALLPLVLVAAWNAFVVSVVPPLLADWLPEPLSWALVGGYVLGALGWAGLVMGSLPIFAHRRALLLEPEAH